MHQACCNAFALIVRRRVFQSDWKKHQKIHTGVATLRSGGKLGKLFKKCAIRNHYLDSTSSMNAESMTFPPFSLSRLLTTVFAPKKGERVAVLIDLEDTNLMKDLAFLDDDSLTIQRKAHDVFYKGLKDGVAEELGLVGGNSLLMSAQVEVTLTCQTRHLTQTVNNTVLRKISTRNMISSCAFQRTLPLLHLLPLLNSLDSAALHCMV